VSLPEHPTKRRKTAADVSPRNSHNCSSPKKEVPVTYGKRSKSVFPSSPTFADSAREQSSNNALGVDVAPSEEAIWNLEGTTHDEFARHEPAMFPEPSSTVPNATMTQQHVLDVINAPTMLGQDSDTVRPRFVPPPEPSVPLSDIWKFTQAEAADIESSDRAPAPDLPSATPLRTSQTNLELSVSQRSRRDSSVRPRESPLRNEVFRAEVANMGQRPTPFEASLDSVSEIPPTAPSKPICSQESSESPRRRKSKATVIATSDDDLAAIGLPKEQYVPRPSRSRSLKVDVEQPIDYSVKPEKAKKASKRRKTTDPTVITTPQKVQQICEMGFTPSTTTAALKRNDGDVTRTIDWLVTNNIGHDELAPQSPPKTKSRSKESEMLAVDSETIQHIMRDLNEYRRDDTQPPQNAVQTMVANNPTFPPEYSDDAAASSTTVLPSDAGRITSPTKVQVVIPKRSPRTTSTHVPGSEDVSTKKPKRRKTTLDQPEHEVESTAVTPVVPEAVTEKKKSRGRPKKAAKSAAPNELVEEPKPALQEEHHNEVLQTMEPNVASGRDGLVPARDPKEKQLVENTASTNTAHAPNQPSKTAPAPASETPERSTEPTSASPSITKGKVPYRVGLSKRARIAPLLRVVKK
jgi:type II secretory pathway pseudopilin PulG